MTTQDINISPRPQIFNTVFLTKIIQTQSRLTEAEFNLNAFMQLVAEQMQTVTPASGAVVELIEGDEMVYRAATGTVATHLGLRLPIGQSISGLCVRTHAVLRSDDTELDSRVNREACRKVSARSLVVAPLFYQGNTVGVLKIVATKPHVFSETDVQTLQLMAGFIASGLAHQLSFETNEKLLNERTHMLDELQTAQKKLYHLAHFDYLTDLANRSTFSQILAERMLSVKNDPSRMGLLYLDIDHFKSINDELGHDIGDMLLRAFAARLKQCISADDLAARLGGDEFVIILNNIKNKDDAATVATKILTEAKKPFEFTNQTLNITTSIGITIYCGEKLTQGQLIKQADSALYQAKKTGRDQFKVFDKIET